MKIYKKSKITASRLPVSLLPDLDDRFAFDLEDTFDFSLDTTLSIAQCYVEDVRSIGNGAGVEYDVIIAIPYDADHWQMKDDIERNLGRYLNDILSGGDYTSSIVSIESNAYSYEVPDDVANDSKLYRATIDVIPFTNIGPYGDYGIDAGYPNDEE